MIIFANDISNNFFENYEISSGGYYNVPCSYDIETTSYYDDNGDKQALTYIHGLMIDNTFIYFRTWEKFTDFIKRLKCLIHPHKLIIYVHNLSYEFQFFCKQIHITNVFARKERRPIKCKSNNIEFRCSYFLTNLSLANLAKNNGYSFKEKYNYDKYRDYSTPLTKGEIIYNMLDCKIVVQHIRKLLQEYDVNKIPLTATAFTRQHTLNYLKNDNECNYLKYRDKIKNAFPTPEIFKILMKCFAGGYTHANSRYANQILFHVNSYDFTSHYPAILFRHKFPYKFNPVSPNFNDDKYATIGLYEFYNISAKTTITYISKHKLNNSVKSIFDNGRLLKSDYISIYLTDIDLKIIDMFYNYDNIVCLCKYASLYKHLPKGLIKSMMIDYKMKTELKGIHGQEDNYLAAKGRLNSFYGMCVTNPLNDEISFTNGEWEKEPITNIIDELEHKKNNFNTFLLYQWGVYCTAWARYDLLQNVKRLEDINGVNHTVYCDTDSIKFLDDFDYVFSEFNKKIQAENEIAAEYFDLTIDDYAPKNKHGKRFEIGLFDCETEGTNNDYREFKTLGAKRYAYLQKYHYHFTVSGIPKKNILNYLKHRAITEHKNILDLFTNELEIPAEYTGKMTMTYIDNATNSPEKSTIHAEKAPFSIDMHEYKTFLDLLFRISDKSSQITSEKPINEINELIFEMERKNRHENDR